VSTAWRGVPAGPVEAAPRGFVPEGERAEILAGVLAGMELGPGTGGSRPGWLGGMWPRW
jgi:hypothetical protein